jgi:hypothetical protein
VDNRRERKQGSEWEKWAAAHGRSLPTAGPHATARPRATAGALFSRRRHIHFRLSLAAASGFGSRPRPRPSPAVTTGASVSGIQVRSDPPPRPSTPRRGRRCVAPADSRSHRRRRFQVAPPHGMTSQPLFQAGQPPPTAGVAPPPLLWLLRRRRREIGSPVRMWE